MFLYIILLLFLIFFIFIQKRPKNYPNGPWGYPILGHVLMMGKYPHLTILDWNKKYGDIVAINFASFKSIAMSDYKLIKEALNHPSFAGRPQFVGAAEMREGAMRGIVFTNERDWIEQRRFCLKNLRDLGFAKRALESVIVDEVKYLIENIKQEKGKPFQTLNKFNYSIVNSLWTIMYGERFEGKNPELQKVVELITLFLSKTQIQQLSFLMPWFCKWFPEISGFNEAYQERKPGFDFIKKKIKEHSEKYVEGSPRDFMDIYQDEINKTTDKDSSFYSQKGQLSMVYSIFDLFLAGSDTTSITLSWMLLFLSLHPEIQEKFRKEIKEIIGNSRLPSLRDKTEMPYTLALIDETLRKSSLTPLGVFRSALENTEFNGYKIPKNTMIITNLYAVHHNASIWGDPFNFRPERFLSEDGKKFVKSEFLMPFSAGRRVCLGESLARDELFLFSTAIIQHFKVTFDPNEPIPTMEARNGGQMLIPQEHKIIFEEIVA